ncbi:MAG: NADP-specific glutamate dehydrogenase [Erysipelotrichaceae bacterium]|nr:NADP-specific glutamate dehydrogenase [Erysipelotrichaceae bacterium]MBR2749539.1 NADP-specific glutamate dehydrogenase [Clostridiales bacterium]
MNSQYLNGLYQELENRYPEQKEYLQAVREVFSSIDPVLEKHPEYEKANIVGRMIEPERIVIFRVPWTDDNGSVQVNRGYRVQFNSAIGPYKGGLRFRENVNLSILKFLGFEQVFKNALTSLPMGGGKGGSDFDPKGRSDREVMAFCQSFMTELVKYIGPDSDVPAGDIGVGKREIGYLYGQYKRLTGEWNGSLTGKGLTYGGSLGRTQATGYGLCYFTEAYLKDNGMSFKDQNVVISGSGNVAIYAAEKAKQLGAKVIAMSDSDGYVYDPSGIDIETIKMIKEGKRDRIYKYADLVPAAEYHEGCKGIWTVPCDFAMPCATQNELDRDDAEALIKNGCKGVFEGANMPSTPEAISLIQSSGLLYSPGKASNAGGVAVSGLEMSQNAQHLNWTFEEVDCKLKEIMINIYKNSRDTAAEYGKEGDLVSGANIAGFVKVANAMLEQGVC